MGSLNGDVLVMRNGRSTSQVSVYNYPEHLNPFYEDDQHKRLRFWKINKKDNEGRRNSFSISNLKDMWAFKSFRMKKKSSTLGINKTSESPPTLRREFVVDNGWNTFDHRLRANNTASMNDESFQRNATYRSSLQTLPTNNDRMGLNRNDGYRSTIQVARSKPRYQPQTQQTTTGVSPKPRRSSQASMVSTNPFESDNEDDNEDINSSGMQSVNGGSTSTLTSRTPRKKRRAPAPPTPIHGRPNGTVPPTILIESSQDNAQDELRIREDMDIANLTAEIQSFVQTKDNDDVEETNLKKQVTTETTKSISAIKTSTPDVKKVRDDHETEVNTTTSKTVSDNKQESAVMTKSNGQVTTEIVTVTTTITTAPTTKEVNRPLERKRSITKVTNEMKTLDESKEVTIKSNGAIPKKPNTNTVTISSIDETRNNGAAADVLCIKEINHKEEVTPQKPVPLKRQTKPETEVGHVECIHVHVESPRSTPRLEHSPSSGVSSFKTEHIETEKITTKTPFVLTSPPTQRRKTQSPNEENNIPETVKILEDTKRNERTNELSIVEKKEINTKPEVLVKPTLSPKPVTESNGKLHTFAEIHKPMRSKLTNTQNGHIRRASRDEIILPPIVPVQKLKQDEVQERVDLKIENKLNNTAPIHIDVKTENRTENSLESERKTESLEIVETSSSNTKEEQKLNNATVSVTTDISTKEVKRELVDEFDLLYRPKPANHMEWKRSTLAPLETHIPPEKRKSVKDIIESINRSQRLLHAAANKDFTPIVTTTEISTNSSPSSPKPLETNNNNFNENLKTLDESEREFQRLVDELEPPKYNGNAVVAGSSSSANSNNEYQEAQKLDNDMFQKCKVKKEVYDYRESSPISSNLDWNPVPKPKRTKPLQE